MKMSKSGSSFIPCMSNCDDFVEMEQVHVWSWAGRKSVPGLLFMLLQDWSSALLNFFGVECFLSCTATTDGSETSSGGISVGAIVGIVVGVLVVIIVIAVIFAYNSNSSPRGPAVAHRPEPSIAVVNSNRRPSAPPAPEPSAVPPMASYSQPAANPNAPPDYNAAIHLDSQKYTGAGYSANPPYPTSYPSSNPPYPSSPANPPYPT